LGANISFGATRTPSRKPSGTSAKHLATAHATATQHKANRRRTRRNPWHASSYGNPAADDNPAGDDPAVRAAAIAALGRWNGSVVVADPNTGRILSVVNQKLATEGAFTPCSTFKPIVALAALKEGLITPDTILRAEPRLRAYGSRNINLTQALAHSSNTFFYKVGQMLGFDRLMEYAHMFGLGEKTASNIPGESAGHFPAEPPKQGGVGMVAYDGLSFDVTPLQMTALVSVIANGGTLYELQYPRTAEEAAQFEPKVRRKLDDLAPYMPNVRDGMAAAVLYGTGRFAYDPQIDIFGKTGTCSENGARLGWFISYSGHQNPKYAVVVLLRGGRSMYGPHAAEIAGKLYHDLDAQDQKKSLPIVPAVTLFGMPGSPSR
jgi:penicillin-binding protein 2